VKNGDLVLVAMLITWPIAFAPHQLQQRPDHVGDVGEGALLVAVAEHRDRLAASACRTKFGMTIRTVRLPRSHRVEEAHDDTGSLRSFQ